MKAADYLRTAAEVIEQRGQLRDKPDGERSMERAVDAYITLNGPAIQTELDGWMFMAVLKLARATAGKPHVDDWTDLAGYAALAAECLERETANVPSSGDVFEDLNLADYAPEKKVFYGENANGPTCQPIGKWIPWQGPLYSTVRARGHIDSPYRDAEVQPEIVVRFRNGEERTGYASDWDWEQGCCISDEPNPHDIVAYRVL